MDINWQQWWAALPDSLWATSCERKTAPPTEGMPFAARNAGALAACKVGISECSGKQEMGAGRLEPIQLLCTIADASEHSCDGLDAEVPLPPSHGRDRSERRSPGPRHGRERSDGQVVSCGQPSRYVGCDPLPSSACEVTGASKGDVAQLPAGSHAAIDSRG
eukprot:2720298-Amphidinium_carterae.2